MACPQCGIGDGSEAVCCGSRRPQLADPDGSQSPPHTPKISGETILPGGMPPTSSLPRFRPASPVVTGISPVVIRIVLAVAVLAALAGFVVRRGVGGHLPVVAPRPGLQDVMSTCAQQARREAGDPPPSTEWLQAHGRDATTQIRAIMDSLDWLGRVGELKQNCIKTDGRFDCDGDGCWPSSDPSRKVFFDPESARAKQSGY